MAISKVGVVGGGLMGHGITQICAQAGWDVVMREVDDDKVGPLPDPILVSTPRPPIATPRPPPHRTGG